jgi:hypothetical protein
LIRCQRTEVRRQRSEDRRLGGRDGEAMRLGSLEAKIRQNIIMKMVVILAATVGLAGLVVPIALASPRQAEDRKHEGKV